MGRKPWATSVWKKKRAEFLVGKKCEWCGTDKDLRINHTQPPNSLPDDVYLSFEGTIVLCNRCNFAYTKGLHLCGVCGKKYTAYLQCYDCFLKTERGKVYMNKRKEQEELAKEDSDSDDEITFFQTLEAQCEKNCSKLSSNCKLRKISMEYAFDVLLKSK